VAEVEPLIPKGRIVVRHEVADRGPELWSDRKKIKQILLNLLSNGLKFTPLGEVALRAGFDRRQVAIAISDAGIGISEENQRNIFEAFGQSESPSPAGG